MFVHLINNGMMNGYYTWTSHGEECNNPPAHILRQEWLEEQRHGASSSSVGGHRQANPTIYILRDAFPFHQMHHDQNQMNMDTDDDDLGSRMAYESGDVEYSDFPGLGMLGGIKTKGWIPRDHNWRFAANRFNGKIEHREPPTSLSGTEIFAQISSHDYPTLILHPKFKQRGVAERLCWTHMSLFYVLPYWQSLCHPYSLDVMHIEKNVFDNITGTILGLEGKTKDDIKARKGLEQQGVWRKLWYKPSGSTSRKETVTKAPYTVTPNEKVEILELIKDAKYPSGYARSLRNKINLDDKKFIGLKTHDCHVMLQRLVPVFIRPYWPFNVVNPLVSLSHWF
ncbi:hypothetical protein QQ045_028381 [Rhodiola kirilowii]